MNILGLNINTIAIFILLLCGCNEISNTCICETAREKNAGFENDSSINKIDSVVVIFSPYAADIRGVDCEYTIGKDISIVKVIKERATLDSLETLLLNLEPLHSDTISVQSVIYCRIIHVNQEIKNLHFGLFNGICYDGVKMKDNLVLKRFIRYKIGYYNYFNKNVLSRFEELNLY